MCMYGGLYHLVLNNSTIPTELERKINQKEGKIEKISLLNDKKLFRYFHIISNHKDK